MHNFMTVPLVFGTGESAKMKTSEEKERHITSKFSQRILNLTLWKDCMQWSFSMRLKI
jgi:hypothetical protein